MEPTEEVFRLRRLLPALDEHAARTREIAAQAKVSTEPSDWIAQIVARRMATDADYVETTATKARARVIELSGQQNENDPF